MDYRCPACERTFNEPGFCPFDGKPLEDAKPDGATERAMPAQPDPRTKPDTSTGLRAFSAKESSSARQDASRELTELYIKPALPKVGMLQWDSYAKTVQQGYEQALQGVDGEAARGFGVARGAGPSAP